MSKTIGIKLADGTFYPILEEGKSEKKVLDLTTVNDNQTTVQVDLYRSDTSSMDDAEYVDTLKIDNLVAHPNGEATLSMDIGIDENDKLTAQIKDPESGGHSDVAVSLINLPESERNKPVDFNISPAAAAGGGLLAAAAAVGAVGDEPAAEPAEPPAEAPAADEADVPADVPAVDETPAETPAATPADDDMFMDDLSSLDLPPESAELPAESDGGDTASTEEMHTILDEPFSFDSLDIPDDLGTSAPADDAPAADVPASDDIPAADPEITFDTTSLDLDDTAGKDAPIDFDLSSLDLDAPAETPAAEAPADTDFDLSSLDLDAPAETPAAEAPADTDFDLSSLDLDAPAETPAAEAPAETPAAEAPADTDFDLSSLDLDAPAETPAAEAPADTDFDLSSLDLDAPAETPAADTSLDLDFPDFSGKDTAATAAIASDDLDMPDFDSTPDNRSSKSTSAGFSSSPLDFSDLYDKETVQGMTGVDEKAEKATRKHVIICIICAIICIIATILILFVIPSPVNLLNGKSGKGKKAEPAAVEKEAETPPPAPAPAPAAPAAPKVPAPAAPLPPAGPDARENEIVISPTPKVAPRPPVQQKSQNITHKIKWGDTLWDLADAYYKNPWKYKAIARYNGIKNPDYIISGTTIIIPAP